MENSQKTKQSKALFLCYHYLKRKDDFSRIWGYDFSLFKNNIDFLLKEFKPISFQNFSSALQGNSELPETMSVLTFDDGLKEHAEMIAPYLAEKNIPALFSVPTCILDGDIAPPQVIHFTTAKYGIRNFYNFIKTYFYSTGLNFRDYFPQGIEKMELYDFYSKVKNALLYQMPISGLKKVCKEIQTNILEKDISNLVEKIYLTKQDLQNLAKAGHSIACHTNSHISFTLSALSDDEWQREIIEPKQILEDVTNRQIKVFSYPYGSSKNKFDFDNWTRKLKHSGFTYALNAYRNFQGTPALDPFWIERYSVSRQDTPSSILSNAHLYNL